MGFYERLLLNMENKMIDYQNVKLYVVKQFKHEGKEYLYTVRPESIENGQGELDVVFLYRESDDVFAHVDSQELNEELFIAVSGLLAGDMVSKDMKKYNV